MGEIIEQCNIGEVILASSAFSTRDDLLDIFTTYGVSEKVNIRMSSGLYEIYTLANHLRVCLCSFGVCK